MRYMGWVDIWLNENKLRNRSKCKGGVVSVSE